MSESGHLAHGEVNRSPRIRTSPARLERQMPGYLFELLELSLTAGSRWGIQPEKPEA